MKKQNTFKHSIIVGMNRLGHYGLKQVGLLLMFVGFGLSANAQMVNTYIFTPLAGTYTPLVGGTAEPSILVDDGTATSSTPIGFNFTFNGTVYTSVTANSNGWLTFNPVANTNGVEMRTNDFATVAPGLHPILAPLWDDLDGRPTYITSGPPVASYATTGAVGSRVFTFEWLNWVNYSGAAAPTNISFQVRLYETTNVIEFQYQQNVGTAGFGGASIGISGSNTNFISLNGATASPTPSTTTSTNSITGRPPSGQIYRFTPPLPCTGAPVAGTVVASPLNVCSGATSFLSLTGNTIASGLAYQWQDSVAPGVWTDIAGATSSTYTTVALSAPHWYRAKVICISTTDTAYTPGIMLTINNFALNYFEDFESITANNQLPNCMTATNIGLYTFTYTANQTTYNRINHTPGGSKFASFRFLAGTDAFITPALTLTAGKTYLFNYWYITDGLAGWNSLEAYWGTANNIAGLTNLIGAAPPPLNNTTYKEFVGTFTPTVTGTYYMGIVCNRTGGPWYLSIDDIGLKELLPCTGTPEAGTINSIAAPCPNQLFTLTTTGTSSPFSFSGLTYQWQDSSNIFGWQNAAGASTNITYTGSITTPTKYRLIVTCSNGNGMDTSDTRLITPASFINCYCIPTYATGAGDRGITNVTLKSLNNTSTISSPYYRDYTPLQPGTISIPVINMTTTDTLKVKHGGFGTNYSGVWIDFDHSGTFGVNEFFSTGTSVGANAVENILVTPPANAIPGLTRMRIRAGDGAAVTAGMPCGPTGSAFGEAEDYLVNVQFAICTGPTNAGRADATDTAICKGYSIDLYDTTHEYRRSQISWSWQSSTDGGASWVAVPGSINKDTLLNIIITQAIRYRLKMMCDATGDSSFSTVANIRIKAAYECYCISQSRGGNSDTSDIGAVVISSVVNSTGGPHILNPTAIRKRTDYTNIRNITLSADGTYRLAIYHTQRNAMHADARVTVFMDFDNDLVYEAFATQNSERVYSGLSTAPRFYIDTFITIPNAVIPNVPTGMRVILNNDLNPLSTANLGCGEYTSGETEDYVVMFNRAPVGVNVLTNLKNVTIFPNPSEGRFSVSAGSKTRMDNVSLTVSNVTGQIILSKQYSNIDTRFEDEVNLGDIARGVYFVEVKTAGGDKMVQKLVIR